MDNLVLLCRKHHRLVHEAGYGVHVAAEQTISFSLPDEKIIPQGPDTRFRGNAAVLRRVNFGKGLKITPKTSIPKWYGDKMDHEMAVDMLLANE